MYAAFVEPSTCLNHGKRRQPSSMWTLALCHLKRCTVLNPHNRTKSDCLAALMWMNLLTIPSLSSFVVYWQYQGLSFRCPPVIATTWVLMVMASKSFQVAKSRNYRMLGSQLAQLRERDLNINASAILSDMPWCPRHQNRCCCATRRDRCCATLSETLSDR